MRDANAEQLRTIDTFLNMGKAHDVTSPARARQDRGAGMPWVNTIAADRAGHVLYADHSVVPNVPDDLVAAVQHPDRRRCSSSSPGCPALDGTRARSGCAWRTDADARAARHLRPGEPADRRSAATGW